MFLTYCGLFLRDDLHHAFDRVKSGRCTTRLGIKDM